MLMTHALAWTGPRRMTGACLLMGLLVVGEDTGQHYHMPISSLLCLYRCLPETLA